MEALILAGGRGTRLRPVTDYLPKPLVPIKNIPIIEWQIRYLKKFDIQQVIVCTGYRADQIQDYLDSRDLGIKVKLSIESTPLGTAGAIKKAARLIQGKKFFVLNGDIITDIDLTQLKMQNSIATIPLQTKYGTITLEKDKIVQFLEKKPIQDTFMNAGIYLLAKQVIKDLPVRGDIEKTLFPKYAKKGLLHGVKFLKSKWYSIDSFKDIEESSRVIQKMI